MSSITNSIYDIAGVFDAAEELLGPNRVWTSVNISQSELLAQLTKILPHVARLKEEGLLESKLSWAASTINDWFATRGFNLTLTETGNPDVFYVGSIYEQLIRWLNTGKDCSITGLDQKVYKGVSIDTGVAFFTSDHIPGVVARLETKDKVDTAYMVMCNQPPSGPFGLLKLASDIGSSLKKQRDYTEIKFPMVHLDNSPDVSWMVDMWTLSQVGRKVRIIEAVQQSILKINREGALAKSAFGSSLLYESIKRDNPLVINSPFLFWIEREGYPLPLFAAWVDYPEWKDPGTL